MSGAIRTVEAVYENGLLRPLEPLQQRGHEIYLVTILEPDILRAHQTPEERPSLRGKYRGYLSSADEFARNKQTEKALER